MAAEIHGPMLQSLLEDRLGLRIHTGIRETPVYSLTFARPEAEPLFERHGDCPIVDVSELRGILGANPPRSGPRYCGESEESPSPAGKVVRHFGVTMTCLASLVLSPYAVRPVPDKTGLEGRFDAAEKQLGLRLRPGKAPPEPPRPTSRYAPATNACSAQ